MKKVTELQIEGKKALIRVDFNVPLNPDGSIGDATRIIEAIPTIQYVVQNKGAAILLSHLGRPKGEKNPSYSLKPCLPVLEKLLRCRVIFVEEAIGEKVKKAVENLQMGEVLLLENLRFYPAEESPPLDPSFAQTLASYGDLFINDAFGTVHRAHSSITEIPKYLKKNVAAGLLLEKEISALSDFPAPFYAIVGGAKVSSKLGILKSLTIKAEALFIGGAMAFTFFSAKNIPIGNSLYERDLEAAARDLFALCTKKGILIQLPEDVVITNGKEHKTIEILQGIPPGWKGVDIGPSTVSSWIEKCKKARSIFWNGPMGVFETPPFGEGTFSLARGLSTLQSKRVIGGGDSICAIKQLGISSHFTHISTGGGASLEFLERGSLPGIEALKENG